MPTPKHTHVVSSTPSRTRLRVSHKRRKSDEMLRIANALKSRTDVHDVRINEQTGSIVIHHSDENGTRENILATLQDLGIILASITGTEMPSMDGKSAVAEDFTSAVYDLNQRVGNITNGIVDLRLLIPIGFALLAIRQAARNGWQIEAAPWYALAYYAFDSFIKLHYTQDKSLEK
ncbi:MAG TPA: hypothetical protein V6D28_02450 [Leptolyngbyaceae cyanobacterium]